MDILTHFWNGNLSEVQTRFQASRFFLRELLEATDVLAQKLVIMLSMDKPNANWKVFQNLKSHHTN